MAPGSSNIWQWVESCSDRVINHFAGDELLIARDVRLIEISVQLKERERGVWERKRASILLQLKIMRLIILAALVASSVESHRNGNRVEYSRH